MSHYATGLVTEYRPYSGSKHLVALQLAEFANTHGIVCETVEKMAERSTLSPRQFRRILRDMETDGWIECIKRSAGGSGVGSEYRINPDWLRLPTGWQVGNNCCEKNTVRTRTEPGHNPDILTGFIEQKPGHPDRVFTTTHSSLKTLPPIVPHASGSAVPSATAVDQSEERKLGAWMLERIRQVHPKHREPNWKRWIREIRVMLNAGKSAREIAELFAFANADRIPQPGSTFCWAAVIRCPGKLWKHWDTLTMRRDAGKPAPVASASSRLCDDCGKEPWTQMEGKDGPKRCSECAKAAERRAA